ncbi:Nucleoid occlusion protein [subsurface metagenome]
MAIFIDVNLIDEPELQDRIDVDMDYITELAQNISENGLQYQIAVRKKGKRFERIWGRCRILAFKRLEIKQIPADIKDVDDVTAGVLTATENLTRKDLTPLEEGRTYLYLHDKLNMTHDKIARKVGKTPGVIKRRMYICRMPENLQQAIHKKLISITVGEELWRIDDETQRDYYLQMACEHGITQRVARIWVDDWIKSKMVKPSGAGADLTPGALLQEKPVYVSCDLCCGPMKLGEEQVLRLCLDCTTKLHNALK